MIFDKQENVEKPNAAYRPDDRQLATPSRTLRSVSVPQYFGNIRGQWNGAI